jgi:hypothetical protein
MFARVVTCLFMLTVLAASAEACDDFSSTVQDEVERQVQEGAEKVAQKTKEELANRLKESDPETWACYLSPSACPDIDDPAMKSEWTQVTNAPIQNSPDQRSPYSYIAVINQFRVEDEFPCRYRPYPTNGCAAGTGSGETRCNVFAGDVMRAMGAPLPTKGDLGVGHGDARDTDPMTAPCRHLVGWFASENGGWRHVGTDSNGELNEMLEGLHAGKPGVALSMEHIAVLRPNRSMV